MPRPISYAVFCLKKKKKTRQYPPRSQRRTSPAGPTHSRPHCPQRTHVTTPHHRASQHRRRHLATRTSLTLHLHGAVLAVPYPSLGIRRLFLCHSLLSPVSLFFLFFFF